MGIGLRSVRDWLLVAGVLGLAALLGWAWYDGGVREPTAMSAPAILPEAVQ